MLWTLDEYADSIKDHEYEELFPNIPVEEVKEDEEKIKEALFQVHQMVYNDELWEKVAGENNPRNSDDYYITMEEIEDCLNEADLEKMKKGLRGATMTMEDGETMIPKTDVQNVLSVRPSLID